MGLWFLSLKCPLTPDCSRAGAVPATQRTSPDPALFSAPDHTHYREYIYYHTTTPYQAKSASPRFRAKCARPLSNVKAGSGNETMYTPEQKARIVKRAAEHGVVANLCIPDRLVNSYHSFHWETRGHSSTRARGVWFRPDPTTIFLPRITTNPCIHEI